MILNSSRQVPIRCRNRPLARANMSSTIFHRGHWHRRTVTMLCQLISLISSVVIIMKLNQVSTVQATLTSPVPTTLAKNDQPRDNLFILQQSNSTDRTNTTTSNKPQTPASLIKTSSIVPANARSFLRQTAHLQSQPQVLRQTSQNSNLTIVRQRWRHLERSVTESMSSASGQLRQILDELNEKSPSPISSRCRVALAQYVDGLAEQRLWASQMFDASARMPSGVLEGTLTELGNFDECLAIRQSSEADQRGADSRGQYCSVVIKPPLIARPRLHTVCQRLPAMAGNQSSKSLRVLSTQAHQFFYVSLRLGICTPSRCSANDIQQLINVYLSRFELIGQVKSCQVAPTNELESGQPNAEQQAAFRFLVLQRFDTTQQCILFTFVLLVFLTLFGTFLDKSNSAAVSKPTSSITKALGGQLGGENHAMSRQRLDRPAMKAATTANQRRLSTTTSHSSEAASGSMGSMTPGSDVILNGNAKRWHYQVYRGTVTTSVPSESSLTYDHEEPLDTQLNPLAEFDVKTGFRSEPTKVKDERIPQAIPPPPMPPPLPEQANVIAAGVPNSIIMDALTSDESWLAQLNGNDNDASSLMAPGNKAESSAQGRARQVNWLVALICCFSLKRSLHTIGKHSRSPESGSHEARNANCKSNAANCMGDIKVIHGVRTFTMIWIIFGHSIGLVSPEMMNNLFSLAQLSCSSRFLQAILNATLAVNTFFMISGLVTVISLVRRCDSLKSMVLGSNTLNAGFSSRADKLRRGKVNLTTGAVSQANIDCEACKKRIIASSCWHHDGNNNSNLPNDLEVSSVESFSALSSLSSSASSHRCIGGHHKSAQCKAKAICERASDSSIPSDYKPLLWLLMRYLRLTPAYAAVIAISILMPALGSGPFWQETINPMGASCRQNWWLNLSYVNNFINTDKLCLIHSWYLSNDWQFFVLSVLLLGIFYKSRKVALLMAIVALVASSMATFTFTVNGDFPPTIVTTSPAVAERWLFIHSLYYKPWPHLPSYLVGIFVGYAIVARHRLGQMNAAWHYAFWLISILISCALLNSIYPWNMGIPIDPMLTGLHSATFRTLWATCCAWFVYALVIKPNNMIARILSWHGFQVTSRLTYSAYLVHPLVIYYHFGTLRERMDSSPYGQIYRFSATMALTYLFAFILAVIVESPSIQIQQYLTDLTQKTKTKQPYQRKGRRETASLSSGEGNPWTVSSSFGDRLSADLPPNVSDSVQSAKPNHETSATGKTPASKACCLHSGQNYNSELLQSSIIEQNPSSGENSVALDAEFQKKLAQAIGRGFKLRSRMINQRTLITSMGQAQAKRGDLGIKKFPEPTTNQNRSDCQ